MLPAELRSSRPLNDLRSLNLGSGARNLALHLLDSLKCCMDHLHDLFGFSDRQDQSSLEESNVLRLSGGSGQFLIVSVYLACLDQIGLSSHVAELLRDKD